MHRIRENIYQVTFAELGAPLDKGFYPVEGLGDVMLDVADLRYAAEAKALGNEPVFFVSRSGALENDFVVVARQQAA